MVGSHDPPTAVAAVQADRLETRTRYDTPGDGLGRAAVRRVLPAAHQGRRGRFGPAVADPRAVRPRCDRRGPGAGDREVEIPDPAVDRGAGRHDPAVPADV